MILFAFKLLTIFLCSLDHFYCDVNLSDYIMPLIALRLENQSERFCSYSALKFQEFADFSAVYDNMHNIELILCGHGVTSMSYSKKTTTKNSAQWRLLIAASLFNHYKAISLFYVAKQMIFQRRFRFETDHFAIALKN